VNRLLRLWHGFFDRRCHPVHTDRRTCRVAIAGIAFFRKTPPVRKGAGKWVALATREGSIIASPKHIARRQLAFAHSVVIQKKWRLGAIELRIPRAPLQYTV
jgi:hypothetical protein